MGQRFTTLSAMQPRRAASLPGLIVPVRRAQSATRGPQAPTERSDVGEALATDEHGATQTRAHAGWCQVFEFVHPAFRPRAFFSLTPSDFRSLRQVRMRGAAMRSRQPVPFSDGQ